MSTRERAGSEAFTGPLVSAGLWLLACTGSGPGHGDSGPGESATEETTGSTSESAESGDTGSSESASETGPDPSCGDGVIDQGEQCDDGDQNGMYGACNLTCDGEGPHCGDGVVDGPEDCDDADEDGLDDCSNDCSAQACGDDIAQAGDLCFSPFVEHATTFDPGPLLTLDLDGDTHLDLLVGDVTHGELVVALGDGSGDLAIAGVHASAPLVHHLVAADFDDDDHVDILAVGRQLGYTVLLGDGTGDFALADSPLIGLESATAADFDADGRADLVLGHDGNTELRLGLGDGSFTVHDTLDHAGLLDDWALAPDLDGDGRPDLVLALDESDALEPSGELRSLVGLGDGDFAPGQDFALADDADRALTADLDGDGRPDLVALRGSQPCAGVAKSCGGLEWRHPTLGEVTAFTSAGLEPGALAPASSVVVGFDPSDLAAADLDSDGAIDVLVTHFSFGWLEWLDGDGQGGLGLHSVDAVGFRHVDVELADLDEDGVDDIILTRAALGEQPGAVRIRLSNP